MVPAQIPWDRVEPVIVMDDLLREFLTETGEHLDTVDEELIRFEQHPDDQAILRNIFRLVHTIKGTCGFLGLPRLEALTHAAETLMGQIRDGMPVTSGAVTLILATIDRVKLILAELERVSAEPLGSDADLIAALEQVGDPAMATIAADQQGSSPPALPDQILLRPLRPGEVSLQELEQAFRATSGPVVQGPMVQGSMAPGSMAPGSMAPVANDRPSGSERLDPTGEACEAGGARNQTIRVRVETLEQLMTTVSELVLTRNQLLDAARRNTDGADGFKGPLQRLSHVTAELQDGIMKTRMQPIGSAWAKLPRLLRDLAPELGKTVGLVMCGAETELDRQVIEIIRDPLTHMVRNALDHGIESPAMRRAAGKPETGQIRLEAFHEGGTITIELADDGGGLDHAAIRRRAIELDLAGAAEIGRLSDEAVAHFIFHSGFSTSRSVSSVSGRGVGMDVVKTNIDLIGGTLDIASQRGRGTTFTIKIPLTLAIVAALIVEVRAQRFAIPQATVIELVRVGQGSAHRIEWINASPVLRLRDALLPVLDLADVLQFGTPPAGDPFVVVAQIGRQRIGLAVDEVLESEEIVVKPMSGKLRHLDIFAGNTILGDGSVVLILDPNGLARRIGVEQSRAISDRAAESLPAEPSEETLTLLVFRGSDKVLKAVPLSLVTRLEEVDSSGVEWVGGRPSIQYRGRLMPLVAIEGDGAIRRGGPQLLVVFSDGDCVLGLAVDEILDVVELVADIQPVAGRPDLVGSAIVRGRATEIIDLQGLLPRTPSWHRRHAGPVRSVLLVENNPFFRDMLGPVLKASGFAVRTAPDAEAALAILEVSSIDAVVADLDLPGRSGLDLVEEMRRRPALRATSAIILSSAADPEILDHARRLDVFDVVAKFDRPGLMAALADATASRFEAAA